MRFALFVILSFLAHFLFLSLLGKEAGFSFSKSSSPRSSKVRFQVVSKKQKKKMASVSKPLISKPKKVQRKKQKPLSKPKKLERVEQSEKETELASEREELEANEPESGEGSFGLGITLVEEASLLSFYAPEYTEEALDSELSGVFCVKVLVSKEGRVLKAKLEETIGYGMDTEVLRAVEEAIFSPSKNKKGEPLEAWTEVHVQLEML